MDTEAFVRWALDDARNVEERYTTELLCDLGLDWWWSRRQVYNRRTLDDRIARERERKLNPAYEPHYTEDDLRKTAEVFADQKSWSPHSDRPVRDITVVGFLPALEEFSMAIRFEAPDVSPFARLPKLRKLVLGYPGSDHSNHACRDFTPLGRCRALRELTLAYNAHWPDLTGLDALTQLDELILSGNLLAMPRGITFPSVRRGGLYCMPLASRNVGDLPQLPNCEFLTLSGAERLDGIERMPRLRNLKLLGPFESFEPLTALRNLTCLSVICDDHRDIPRMPRDLSPLVRVPQLHYFEIGTSVRCLLDLPRDYACLTDAPALRQLVVKHCPPVEVEVASINAALPPWDDLFLLPEPRPLPPLRMVIAPPKLCPPYRPEVRLADEAELMDFGLRECEAKWAAPFATDFISRRVGHRDWGEVSARGQTRTFYITLHSFETLARVPVVIEAIREVMARLRHDWGYATFCIHLRVPPPEDTEAQKELLRKFQDAQHEAESEQRERDEAEYLERLHRLELKKQEGAEINPEEFSPSEPAPYPIPPWREVEDDGTGNEDEDDDEGDVATKEKPAPPAMFFDDEHPLARNYYLSATITPAGVWFQPRQRDLAIQLMRREADEEFPDEEKKES